MEPGGVGATAEAELAGVEPAGSASESGVFPPVGVLPGAAAPEMSTAAPFFAAPRASGANSTTGTGTAGIDDEIKPLADASSVWLSTPPIRSASERARASTSTCPRSRWAFEQSLTSRCRWPSLSVGASLLSRESAPIRSFCSSSVARVRASCAIDRACTGLASGGLRTRVDSSFVLLLWCLQLVPKQEKFERILTTASRPPPPTVPTTQQGQPPALQGRARTRGDNTSHSERQSTVRSSRPRPLQNLQIHR